MNFIGPAVSIVFVLMSISTFFLRKMLLNEQKFKTFMQFQGQKISPEQVKQAKQFGKILTYIIPIQLIAAIAILFI